MHPWRGIRLGRPFGISLVVHGSWFPAAALLVCVLSLEIFHERPPGTAIPLAALTTLGMFMSVLVQELFQVQIARSIGIPVRDMTLFLFGGITRSTREPSAPRQEAAIGLAGPVASLLVGFVLLALPIGGDAGDVITTLGWGNLTLAGVNLLPGFPLDGGRVLRAWLWSRSGDPHRASIRVALAGQLLSVAMIVIGFALAWTRGAGGALWVSLLGGFLYVIASSARRAARVASRLARQSVGSYVRPMTGTLTGDESAAYVRSNGGGPYAVAKDGRLEGVLLPGSLEGGVDPFARVRDLMVPWTPRITCSDSLPVARALERLAVSAEGVLVVVDDTGSVVGILDHAGVRRRLESSA